MGFFDRFSAKKEPAPTAPNTVSNSGTTPPFETTGSAAAAANVKALLLAGREKLEAKDLTGAMALYEELLRTSGDRPDVLVALSGDLGSCGYVPQIVELIAPRYDAMRHGPATGLNLLQAYLATRNTTAAQHLLDILFALQRPELEERLYGFSNALAEMLELERRGELAPSPTSAGNEQEDKPQQDRSIGLVSITRPIWSYGLEQITGIVPPPKQGKLRRIAFGQLALLGVTDFSTKLLASEDEITRFTRGFPLWLAETFYFSPHYAPIAALGMMGKERFALFPSEWTAQHIRQLVDTSEGLDYVFTGALKHTHGDYELIVRVWEVKKFRERKQFTARWTPATADTELTKLHEQIRVFMEWQVYPEGPAYAAPTGAYAWCDSLGLAVSLFLAEKNVLPKDQLPAPVETLARLAERAATSEKDSLVWLTANDRARRLELSATLPATVSLVETPAVEQARQALTPS